MGKAAEEGDLARVREAIDMNPTSTSMGKAAEEGDLARVREAVEAGEDVNQADPARVSAVVVSLRTLVYDIRVCVDVWSGHMKQHGHA